MSLLTIDDTALKARVSARKYHGYWISPKFCLNDTLSKQLAINRRIKTILISIVFVLFIITNSVISYA